MLTGAPYPTGLASGENPDQSPNLETRAHDALADWLINENPEPGAPVPIREVARRLNMSRTPVRAAVGRLCERGLLAYDSSRGFTVGIPSLGSIYELFELRLMMELHSLRMHAAGGRPLPGQFRESVVEADALRAQALADHDQYIAFRRNDTEFHRLLVRLSGLPRMSALHDDLDLSIHVTRAGLDAPITSIRLKQSHDEHAAIVDALERGDHELAEGHLDAHITRIRDQTISYLSRPHH